jgi:uncharacterized membrane protein
MRLSLVPLLCFAAAATSAVAVACSGGSSADPADAGATCPIAPGCPASGPPSYSTEILPILQQSCIGCHSAAGTAGYDETTYANVYGQRSPMLDQVSGCLMPPQNGPQLTAAQRTALTAWLECGAPDN